jgi:hypothetical protein
MEICPQCRVQLDPMAAKWRHVGDTIVVMDLTNSVYFSIGGSITAVWPDLVEGAVIGELASEMAARFEAPVERVLADLIALMSDLAERSVVTIEPSS